MFQSGRKQGFRCAPLLSLQLRLPGRCEDPGTSDSCMCAQSRPRVSPPNNRSPALDRESTPKAGEGRSRVSDQADRLPVQYCLLQLFSEKGMHVGVRFDPVKVGEHRFFFLAVHTVTGVVEGQITYFFLVSLLYVLFSLSPTQREIKLH